jgi:hypothetical protein
MLALTIKFADPEVTACSAGLVPFETSCLYSMQLGLLKPIISFCCDLKLMQYTGGRLKGPSGCEWRAGAAQTSLPATSFTIYHMHPAAGLHKVFFLAF